MFIFIQLFFIYFFYCCEENLTFILVGTLNLYILLLYLANYSYILLYKNRKYSFPIFKLTYYPELGENDKIHVMWNFFNYNIINDIKNKYFPYIELHMYNYCTNKLDGIDTEIMDLSLGDSFPDMSGSKIRRLIIDKNRIDVINNGYLPKKLIYLSARQCNIASVELINITLRELDFSFNKLKEIYIKSNTLRRLYLNNNELISIKLDTPNLKFLDISHNYIENFEVKNMELETLNISNNQFIVLPTIMLKIPRLYLKNNPIIPNLNSNRWSQYFQENYIEFFQNNFDYIPRNVYEDKELVHNPAVNNSIKNCIIEIQQKYKLIQELEHCSLFDEYICDITDIKLEDNFNVQDLIDTIYYLIKEKNLEKELIPIINYELEDGKYYCLSGKIGRLITSIMGFNLIENIVSVSKNDEIMAKYEIVIRKLKNEENNAEYKNLFRKEFNNELLLLGISQKEINDWLNEIG